MRLAEMRKRMGKSIFLKKQGKDLIMFPISWAVIHSHQARFLVYLYGAPSQVKIVCRRLELYSRKNMT